MTNDYQITAHFSENPPRTFAFPRWEGKPTGIESASYVRLSTAEGLVSFCRLHATTVKLQDGQKRTIAGIGGVSTISFARHRGYGKLLVMAATTVACHRWKPDACLLFSFAPLVGWYEAMGWQVTTSPVKIQQPEGRKILLPPSVSVLTTPRIEGIVEIESLPW